MSQQHRLPNILSRAAVLFAIFVATLAGCGRTSDSHGEVQTESPGTAAKVASVKTELQIASGDEQQMVEACTSVFSTLVYLYMGYEPWLKSVVSEPWFDKKDFELPDADAVRLFEWLEGSNKTGLAKYLDAPNDQLVVELLRDNGWPDAQPAVNFQHTEAGWNAINRRMRVCASLSKGRVPEAKPSPAQAPTITPAPTPPTSGAGKNRAQESVHHPAGHPPMILEVQPE